MTTNTNPTRRSFLAGIAAATAATALPALALDETAQPKRTNDRHAIPELPGEATDTLRAWYAAAVAEVATQLRPRFESGELRGLRDEDDERLEDRTWTAPNDRVEEECGLRFVRGSMPRAYAILAVSPSEVETFDGACNDPRYHAAHAMSRDVIRYARAQGWTVMTADEEAPGAVPGTRRYYSGGYFKGWSRGTNGWRA